MESELIKFELKEYRGNYVLSFPKSEKKIRKLFILDKNNKVLAETSDNFKTTERRIK